MGDFTNRYPMSGPGAYTTLAKYNVSGGPMAPVPSDTPSMAVTVVPVMGSLGYDALTHGTNMPSNGSYFTITGAYPAYDQGCTTFTQRMCA